MTNGADVVKDVMIAAITAFPPSVLALLAWRKGIKNSKALQQVHVQIDGRLHQLIDATKKLAKAEGYKAGLSAKRMNPSDRRKKNK
jgi:hypothetical protein